MEGNGESDVWVIYEDFSTIVGEFWRNWFIVKRRLRTSIKTRPTKKTRF